MSGKIHLVLNESSSEADLKTFLNYISTEKCIVLVHASWCGHCHTLRGVVEGNTDSEWSQFVEKAKDKVNIFDVEAKAYEKVKSDVFSVVGYPTIFKFENGESKEYDGERNAESILEFVEESTRGGGRRRQSRQQQRKRSQRQAKKQSRRRSSNSSRSQKQKQRKNSRKQSGRKH